MNFRDALVEAQRRSGFSNEMLAVKIGVRENTIARWRGGQRVPTGPLWQALRDSLPYFAELIDSKAAVA